MAVVSTFMCRPWSFLLPFPAPPIRTVLFGIDFASKVVCQRALLSPVGSVKRFKMQRILRSPLATRVPTSFCTSGYRRALLARMASSDVGTHRICLLFCKEVPVVPRRFSQVYLHLLCLLFSVSRVSKRHFPNGNRRQPPPCLLKSETDGRKSMAAQPFIPTIDGVRPFCYTNHDFE